MSNNEGYFKLFAITYCHQGTTKKENHLTKHTIKNALFNVLYKSSGRILIIKKSRLALVLMIVIIMARHNDESRSGF
jgi:hypothetical protein